MWENNYNIYIYIFKFRKLMSHGFFSKADFMNIECCKPNTKQKPDFICSFLVREKDFFEHWSYFSFRKLKTNEKSFSFWWVMYLIGSQ